MTLEDVETTVGVHLSSFPGFFLSFLGTRFLRLYYSGICSAPESIAFLCLNEAGEAMGFVAGAINPQAFYSRLLKRDWLRFGLASLAAICCRPQTMPRIARAFFHPSNNPGGRDIAGLFSIAVKPEMQGTGAGKKLILRFIEEAKRKGCTRVFLTTDRDHNDRINSFYQKLGFVVRRQYETPEGRWMNEFWIEMK